MDANISVSSPKISPPEIFAEMDLDTQGPTSSYGDTSTLSPQNPIGDNAVQIVPQTPQVPIINPLSLSNLFLNNLNRLTNISTPLASQEITPMDYLVPNTTPPASSTATHIDMSVTQTDNSEGPVAPKGPNAPPTNSPNSSNVLPTGNPSSPSTPTTENHVTSPTAGTAADFAPRTVEPFGTGPGALQLTAPVGDDAPGSATGFAPPTIAPLGDSPNALQPTTPNDTDTPGNATTSFPPPDADTPGNATTGFAPPTITPFGTGPNALQPTVPIGAPVPTSDPTLPASVLLAENRKANKMRPTNSNTARNLCAKDWCTRHVGGTTAEFKEYFDNLSPEQIAHFEKLSADARKK